MNPINPPEEYGKYIVLAKNQDEYLSLPARIDAVGVFTTLWNFSDEERQAIAQGKNLFLELHTFGNPVQPLHLWVEGQAD